MRTESRCRSGKYKALEDNEDPARRVDETDIATAALTRHIASL